MKNELMKPDNNGFGIEPYQLDKYRYLEKKLKLKKALPGKNENLRARQTQRETMTTAQKILAAGFIGTMVLSLALMIVTGNMLWLLAMVFSIMVGAIGVAELESGKNYIGKNDKQHADQYRYMKKLVQEDGIEKIYSDMQSADRLFKPTWVGQEYIFIKGSGFFRLSDITDVAVTRFRGSRGEHADFDVNIKLGENCGYKYDLLGMNRSSLSDKKLTAKKELLLTRQKTAKGEPLKELPYADIGRNSFGADPHKAEMYAQLDKRFCISKRENSVLSGYELGEFRNMKKVMHDIIKKEGVDSVYSDLSTAVTLADGVLMGKKYLFLEGRVFFGLTNIVKTEVKTSWVNAGYIMEVTVDHGDGSWKGYSTKNTYTIDCCMGRFKSKLEEYDAIADKIMTAQKEAEKIRRMTDTQGRNAGGDIWGNMHFTDIDEINRLVDIESLGALQYDFEHRDKDIGDDCCMVGRLYVFIKGRTIIRIKDIVGVEIVNVQYRNGDPADKKPDISGREISDSDLEDAEFIRIDTYMGNVSKSYDVCLMKDHDALVKFRDAIFKRKADLKRY